ncbi:MAG: FAD binding domain-containing protein, partial [Candidatus Binataceae bacterium]
LTTALEPGEILTQISFSPLPPRTGYSYIKHRQPASGFALVGAAVALTLDSRGNCERARVGITGLAAKAFRPAAVESALNGKKLDAKAISAAASQTADGTDPLSDIHASADFRAELTRVYTGRAIEQALARVKS